MLDHEKNDELFFSSLQSEFARKELAAYNYDFSQMNTFALIKDDRAYFKSDAALNLSSFLKAPYSWLTIFKIVPRFIRNVIYDWVARNRKKWFKREYCCSTSPEQKKRFLD
jgi:predicted DCC family thiol-disulfide oxidoreductase YuxK